jgi:hypothetical protein
MTRQGQIALVIFSVAAALLFLQVTHRRNGFQAPVTAGVDSSNPDDATQPKAGSARSASGPAVGPTGQEPVMDALAAAPRMKPPAQDPVTTVADTAESASLPPKTILENMGRTIQQYASMFGENPVGTNPEITGALQGDNPKHINFLKQDGNRVNEKGELVDPWGTPYFFHQISGHEMEIRSAGADRVMYTGDDLVTK